MALNISILILDMYENAYQMDYGPATAKYIETFMQNLNCEEANKRMEMTMKMSA